MQTEIEIIMKLVNEIIPYWRNPRRNDKTVDELVKTIPVSGFNVPIVIDKNGVVVKGHARLKAAKRLGMTEVPCIVSDASEDVIKADRIADNKIQELSSWNFGRLNIELNNYTGKMKFERLFRPEKLQESKDENFVSNVEFKPVGLQYWDGDYYGDDSVVPIKNEENKDEGAFEPHAIINTTESKNAVERQNKPEKRQLKTLCPYCGKVVIIDV